MATGDTHFDSDGKAVNVDLSYTVVKGQVAVVEGWLGLASDSGDSGDTIALNIDRRGYQLVIPGTLSVAKGDIIYVEVADVTGHTPDSTAYSTTSGAGKQALGRAATAHYTGVNSERVVDIILLPDTV